MLPGEDLLPPLAQGHEVIHWQRALGRTQTPADGDHRFTVFAGLENGGNDEWLPCLDVHCEVFGVGDVDEARSDGGVVSGPPAACPAVLRETDEPLEEGIVGLVDLGVCLGVGDGDDYLAVLLSADGERTDTHLLGSGLDAHALPLAQAPQLTADEPLADRGDALVPGHLCLLGGEVLSEVCPLPYRGR